MGNSGSSRGGGFKVDKKAREVDASGSSISELPPKIGKMVLLEKLNLADNMLADIPVCCKSPFIYFSGCVAK
jgi:hypothetical protein